MKVEETMRQVCRFLARASMVLIVLGLCLTPLPVAAQGDCDADLSAELASNRPDRDVVHLEFAVEVGTQERCARISYDLVLEIQTPSGQVQKIRKPRVVRLSDGSLTDMVRHEMRSGASVLDFAPALVECNSCDD